MLLEENMEKRKNIYEDFMKIKKFRDNIIHNVLLYDLMTFGQKSKTFDYIDKLEDWIFNALEDFLDSERSFNEWQKKLADKLFCG